VESGYRYVGQGEQLLDVLPTVIADWLRPGLSVTVTGYHLPEESGSWTVMAIRRP
jgi:hypothetical protein